MGMLILLLIAPIGLGLVALALAALGQWFEDLFKFFDYNEVSSPCEAIAACPASHRLLSSALGAEHLCVMCLACRTPGTT